MNRKLAVAVLLALAAAPLAAQTPSPASPWNVMLGPLVVVTPTHTGSDQYRVLPIPFMQITYRDRVYLGPSNSGLGGGIGANLVRTRSVTVSAEFGIAENRPADRADVLAGTTDRDVMGTAGASLSYQLGPLGACVGVVRGLNDGGGMLGTAQVSLTAMMRNRVIVKVSGAAAAADAQGFRRDFGLTPIEAARRAALIAAGDDRLRTNEARVYRPDGGVSQISANLSVIYLISQHWAATAFGSAAHLGDKAAESPLVRNREQWSSGIGIVWRR